MATKRQNSTDKMMNDLQREYSKFLSLSKKKFGNGKDEIKEEDSSGGNVVGGSLDESPTQETVSDSPKKSKGFKSKFTNFFNETVTNISNHERVQVMRQTFSQTVSSIEKLPESDSVKNFKDLLDKKIVIWKTPEPLKRPENLELGLIGVALFKGNEMISKAIRKLTKSRYSHVALLMHDVTKQISDQDGWYIYSANGSASQILDDHRFPQVQLEKWSDNIKDYDGAAGVRLFLYNSGAQPESKMITELVDKYLGLPYETQLLVMLKAMNRSNIEGDGHANSAFCSEICYRFLVSVGVLEDNEIPENVWPKDFSDENDKLPLKDGQWGDLVVHKGRFSKTVNVSIDHQDSTVSASIISPDNAARPIVAKTLCQDGAPHSPEVQTLTRNNCQIRLFKNRCPTKQWIEFKRKVEIYANDEFNVTLCQFCRSVMYRRTSKKTPCATGFTWFTTHLNLHCKRTVEIKYVHTSACVVTVVLVTISFRGRFRNINNFMVINGKNLLLWRFICTATIKKKPQVTIFTSPTCSLCHHFKLQFEPFAKQVAVNEIDISINENKHWFDLYKYDIPVLHFEKELLLKHYFNDDVFKRRLTVFLNENKSTV